ncbi:FAD dependent oxidoreductase [Niveomyces insectorum RCEF 264]|uniref:FAD dependent oxidoreductase n=1 Tax=Niveomyces insectorum RCEF 264 TaxID=1081102 RepID=A0A167Q817_9HYPO|nr:FAD dependent oxidoreductase [Niveomyces insectorum RCEF 264]
MSKLPVPNSTTSFWRAEPLPLDNHRSTPDLPAEVDIAVVGAGYAGASTVYHILQYCKEHAVPIPKIVILEARQACSGATGRNGGQLKPDPFNRPASIAAKYGMAAAAECASFEAAHVPAIKRVVEENNIDCDFVLTRCCDVSMTDAGYARMKAGADQLRKGGVAPVVGDLFTARGAQAEQLSGVRGAKGCFTYTAGHLFPYKLIHGLLALALAQGGGRVNLQTNTPVTAASRAPDAAGWLTLATTPERGTVRARTVVYATNAYTASLLPEYKDRIVPVRGICSHIAPPPSSSSSPGQPPASPPRPPSLSMSYMLRWSPTAYEYLIPRLDGSIVVGGARSEYLSDLGCWYDNVGDDALIGAAAHYFDGYMQRNFTAWEKTPIGATKVWTGIMGYASDNLPHIGAVPGRSNQFILAGFSGHGMPQVFLSAKGVAAMVMGGVSFAESGVPRLYETTQTRLDSTINVPLEMWRASLSQPAARL